MRPRRRPPGLYVVQSACAGRSHDGARHELNLEFDDALARDAAAAHSDAKDVWHVVVVLPLFREVDAGDGAVFSVGADGDAEASEEGVKGDGQLVLVEQQLGDHRSRVGDNVPHLVHLVGPAPAAEAVQVRLLAESLVRLLLDIAQPRHLLHRLACQLARDGSKGRHRLPRSQPCGGRRRQAYGDRKGSRSSPPTPAMRLRCSAVSARRASCRRSLAGRRARRCTGKRSRGAAPQ
mmetsp:Transcript_16716/g.49850  ORF Transcript_16716/g.49850 Transcript_16716/m.49850 type:complete len:235 (-) Transcript_16716:108-812(-)